MRRLVLICMLATVVAGCDGSHSASPPAGSTTQTAPTAPTTNASPTMIALRIYLLRDGKLAPVERKVVETRAVAGAALMALLEGPTGDERAAGLSTSLPANLKLGVPAREDGDTLDLGATPNLSPTQAAQIVYTLTQFPSVRRVRLGSLVFTRRAFEDQTPAILVESPLPGETVPSPVRVQGTANTFEATFQLELDDASGKKRAGHFVTATSGSGERGTFDTTLIAPSATGRVTLVAYEVSAANGQRIHEVRIPLVVAPG